MSCNLIPSNEVLFRDQQHASRVFADDDMRLAPKFKFLFHVSFGINPAAVRSGELIQRYRNEINLLVKSVKLPDIDIRTETLNQYNRKKVVQVQQRFQPINIKFHEDNMGLINLLWQNYYSYYYADPLVATTPGAYARNAMLNANYTTVPYGLDNGSTVNFFNYVKVYQMARHQYICYTLHNPLISRWTHDQLDYSSKDPSENSMSIDYEAVSYSSGRVTPGDPEGFAVDHYDQTPSPLRGGPSNELTIQNSYPILPSVSEAVRQINTAQNTKTLENFGPLGVINKAISTVSAINAGVSGIANVVFPTVSRVASTVANIRKLF